VGRSIPVSRLATYFEYEKTRNSAGVYLHPHQQA